MSLTEKQKTIIPIYSTYTNMDQVKADLHRVYDLFQPKTHRQFSSAPVAHQLREREIVFMDDDSSVRRIYTKLNGTIRYAALT